jgi:hypothetical protein
MEKPKDDFAEFLARSEQKVVDTQENFVAKLRLTKHFTKEPEWIRNIITTPETRPSSLIPDLCYIKLIKLREEMKIPMHPVYTMETVLSRTPAKYNVEKLAYVDEDKKNVEIVQYRGFYLLDKANECTSLAAAHVAELTAFYSQATVKGDVIPTVSDNMKKNLGFKDVDVEFERKEYAPVETNASRARDMTYTALYSQQFKCFSACSKLCLQNKDAARGSTEATALVAKLIKDSSSSVKPFTVAFPFPADQMLINQVDLQRFWKFYFKCREARGEEKKKCLMMMGSVTGVMTKMIAKSLMLFWDIKYVLDLYQTRVVWVRGKLKEYVLRMLIANDYYVISSAAISAPTLTLLDIKNSKFGYYGGVADDVPYVVYHQEINVVPPSQKDGVVTFTQIDMTRYLVSSAKPSNGCVGSFFYSFLDPYLDEKDKEYGILPSAVSYTGQVIICSPKVSGYPVVDLTSRSSKSITVRNNYLIYRRPFCHIDPYNQVIPYTKTINLPKLSLEAKKKEVLDFTRESDKLPGLAPDDMKLTILESFLKPKPKESNVVSVEEQLVQSIRASANVPNAIHYILFKWDDVQSLPANVLLVRNKLSKDLFIAYLKEKKWEFSLDDVLESLKKDLQQQKPKDVNNMPKNVPLKDVPPKKNETEEENFTDNMEFDDSAAGKPEDKIPSAPGKSDVTTPPAKPPPNNNNNNHNKGGGRGGGNMKRGGGGKRGGKVTNG